MRFTKYMRIRYIRANRMITKFIVRFGGSNAWAGRSIFSFTMRLNSRRYMGT